MQFLDLFNDIQINRYTRDGTFLKRITVPLQYGPKEKTWYWVNQRKDDEMLPILGASLTGVEYSLERQTNKHRKIVASVNENSVSRYLNPVPYDINFQLGVWSLYMYDVDQILEQILPFFQPYVHIRIPIEELSTSFEAKVNFSSAAPEFESEYADEGRRVLKYTLDFIVQTYMFKPIEDQGTINDIFVNFYLNDNAWAARNASSTFTSGASGESMRLYTGSIEEREAIFGVSANDPTYHLYDIYQFGDRVGRTQIYDGGSTPVSADYPASGGYLDRPLIV